MPPRASSGPAIAAWSLLLAAGLLACGGEPDTAPQVRPGSLTVSPEHVQVAPASSYFLVVHARDATGHAVPLDQIAWTTTAPEVASADSTARITSRSTGNAVITATAAGVTDSVFVSVGANGVAGVTVAPSSATIAVGATTAFTAAARDAAGDPIRDPVA